MAVIPKYAKLRTMSIEELIPLFDTEQPDARVGLGFLRDEIARRETERHLEAMSTMTHQMRNMTVLITLLTAINAAFTYALFVR